MVWTSYPSAGSKLDVNISLAPLRGALFALGSDNDSALANAEIFGKKPLKDIHIEAEIFKADSHDGPNWWTGNAVQPRVLQQRGAAIIAYKAKTLQKLLFGGRTHAWFPKFQFERTSGPEPASCNAGEGTLVLRRRGRRLPRVVLRAACQLERQRPVERQGDPRRGFAQLLHPADRQSRAVWLIRDVQGPRARGAYSRRRPARPLHGFRMQLRSAGRGRLELHYDNDEARSNGMPVNEDHFPRFRNPFARVAWRQDRYAIQHGDASLTHDIPGNRRIEGARLTELVHAAPLRFYTQNMGLLANVGPVNLYKGFDRDDAIDRLAAILREKKFDVVGLSEFFEADERERLLDKVGDLYPFRCEGPHEGDIPIVDVELAGGGLFLLSRHRITRSQSSIYRQYSGDDGLANKGVLHACIEPVGFPCGFDLFLSHTQAPEPTVGGSVAGARNAVLGQIAHLSAFIDSCRDPMQPALLMGDLNVDFYGDRPLYDYLMRVLNGAVDLKPTTDNPGVTRPDATSESDHHDISSFHEDHPARDPEDEARFSDTTQRLDYVLSFPGRLYVPGWGRGRVVINQVSPGRDLSDHYGIEQSLESITQRFPAAEPVQRARVTLAGIRCLQTTSGPGDDEVSISLSATGGGSTASLNTGELDDMSAGSERRPELAPLFVDIVQGELVVSCSGKEHDDLSADDSLGSSSIVLESDELASLRDAPLQRVMPLLRGDGGEYAVRIVISVE
jgi:endonuclease/exonuclease/phosphatase family metal-dependent hydrolase